MNDKASTASGLAQELGDQLSRYDEVKAALIARRGKRYALAVMTAVDLSVTIMALQKKTNSTLERMLFDHMGKDVMHLGFLTACTDEEVKDNAPNAAKLDAFVEEMQIVGDVRTEMVNAVKNGLSHLKG